MRHPYVLIWACLFTTVFLTVLFVGVRTIVQMEQGDQCMPAAPITKKKK